MANPSVNIPDELLDDFDEIILQKEAKGELPRKVSRSQVITQLVEEYVEKNLSTLNRSKNDALQPAD